MYALEQCGCDGQGNLSFEARLKSGQFVAIVDPIAGAYRVWFNSSATKGSARRFPSAFAALEFVHARREKNGYTN